MAQAEIPILLTIMVVWVSLRCGIREIRALWCLPRQLVSSDVSLLLPARKPSPSSTDQMAQVVTHISSRIAVASRIKHSHSLGISSLKPPSDQVNTNHIEHLLCQLAMPWVGHWDQQVCMMQTRQLQISQAIWTGTPLKHRHKYLYKPRSKESWLIGCHQAEAEIIVKWAPLWTILLSRLAIWPNLLDPKSRIHLSKIRERVCQLCKTEVTTSYIPFSNRHP